MKEKNYIHGTTASEQQRLHTLNQMTNESFVRYLGDDINKFNVCDVGCGLGNLIQILAEKYPSMNITGLELSTDQYRIAREINRNYLNVKIINADALHCGLPDNTFDLAYCRYVMEHVSDPIALVKEMLRMVVKNGRIVCQENDLHNTLFYPEIPKYELVKNAFCNLQIDLNGDPFVGRKLFSIFKSAGVRNIRLSYKPEIFSEDQPESYRMWMQNSLNILLGSKEQLLGFNYVNENTFSEVCSEMEQRIKYPLGVALFHWNRVTGEK